MGGMPCWTNCANWHESCLAVLCHPVTCNQVGFSVAWTEPHRGARRAGFCNGLHKYTLPETHRYTRAFVHKYALPETHRYAHAVLHKYTHGFAHRYTRAVSHRYARPKTHKYARANCHRYALKTTIGGQTACFCRIVNTFRRATSPRRQTV